MRRIMLPLIIFGIMFLSTAYIGEKKQDDRNLYSKNGINITENIENLQVDSDNNTQAKSHNNNILIAYFTWADNVIVENPSEIDVDASTSASVLAPGNVAQMAILSFIEENDLAGKKIILFCSHGTGGLASGVQDISAELTDSVVEKNVIGIYREDIGDSQNRIKDWLKEIGY